MTSIPNAVESEPSGPDRRLRLAPAREPRQVRVPSRWEGRAVDVPAAERAAADLLVALGADLRSDGLRETPRRMAAAYAELLTPEPFNLTSFPNAEGYDELVLVRDIPFQSLCMHHLLPFHGLANAAYLPNERIL